MEAILLIAFFLLIAFPVHEFFHAFAANRLGDRTPRMFGRLTLNPIAHFHPVGGTMLVISVLVAGIPLGFAATPINPRQPARSLRRGDRRRCRTAVEPAAGCRRRDSTALRPRAPSCSSSTRSCCRPSG